MLKCLFVRGQLLIWKYFGHLLFEELPIYLCIRRSVVLQKFVGYLFTPARVDPLIAGPPLQGETRWVQLVLGCHILELYFEYMRLYSFSTLI